jgi:ribonuclease P protein subunit RPR2
MHAVTEITALLINYHIISRRYSDVKYIDIQIVFAITIGRSYYIMKKHLLKMIASERIQILIANALCDAKQDRDDLADYHAHLAKKIAMRLRLRLPYIYRQLYCKKCKRFIVPGKNSRIRIGRSRRRSIRITCLKCGHTYHKILGNRMK